MMLFRKPGVFFCFSLVGLAVLIVTMSGCAGDRDTLFERLPPARTGIDFANPIVEDDSLLNPFDMEYIYNGAGVAVGDFDGDGRPDLYFAGNQTENRLYLNRGRMRFEDVTAAAGVGAEDAWATGVAAVDINRDGLLDLYVCVAGPGRVEDRANLLFINRGVDADGVPRFAERAAAYGLDDTGYSTHAAFFDYDRDGDLDLYLLTNALDDVGKRRVSAKRTRGEAPSTDRLYRNDGDPGSHPESIPPFTDVSREAGIQIEGYGLGVVVSDLNRDGWPDVYVANDFLTNDLVYVNNGDGTFTNRADVWLKSQTHNGMGADVADYDNDGRPDIVVLDMLPPDNERQKMMIPSGNRRAFQRALEMGYEPQYLRNTLQLNRGPGPDGELVFSEVGRLAGIAATDWSWAPLFADFDNDGWKDLFVTNGYGKDVTSLDFVAYGNQVSTFGTEEANRRNLIEAMKALDEVRLSNVMYRNARDLGFDEVTEAWGLDGASLSNGAAFADLDGDGDLDLVTNNLGAEASVFENHLSERDTAHTYLRVTLEGPPGNRQGLGTRLALRGSGGSEGEPRWQYHEHTLYRGYKSTVEPAAHFGLGGARSVDTLEVRWPDGRFQRRTGIAANQTITVRYAEAQEARARAAPRRFLDATHGVNESLFEEVAEERGLVHRHVEYEVDDFRQTPLLPRKLSRGGPALAVGDVDGDGRDDLFVGADRRQERRLFVQTASGRFEARPFPMPDTERNRYEDRGALLFDADGDGALDLYLASGGNHAPAGDPSYRDRLYLGDGRGSFRRVEAALPELSASASVVAAADFDDDGDLDLFVGGRHVPGRYPLPPRSYLLENRSEPGTVRFTDVTDEVAPGLAAVGMVTDALWTDVDRDGRIDLLVAGEWMPLRLFRNRGADSEGAVFAERTAEAGLSATSGWWNGLVAGDFDDDGDLDYVAGGYGANNPYRAASETPVRIYAKDFDRNGRLDPVVTRYVDGKEVPMAPRDLLIEQIPTMKRRFPTYRSYAEARFAAVFTDEELAGTWRAEATRLRTSYLENRGDGTFRVRALPPAAQVGPVYGMGVGDYDGDGALDLLVVGNSQAEETTSGWQNASVGLLLRGDGGGGFEAVDPAKSGFRVAGNAKALVEVVAGQEAGAPLVVVSQTEGPLTAFARRPPGARAAPSERIVRVRPTDRYALFTFADGRQRRVELYHGAGHLSQSSRMLRVPAAAVEVTLGGPRGEARRIGLDDGSRFAESSDGK